MTVKTYMYYTYYIVHDECMMMIMKKKKKRWRWINEQKYQYQEWIKYNYDLNLTFKQIMFCIKFQGFHSLLYYLMRVYIFLLFFHAETFEFSKSRPSGMSWVLSCWMNWESESKGKPEREGEREKRREAYHFRDI